MRILLLAFACLLVSGCFSGPSTPTLAASSAPPTTTTTTTSHASAIVVPLTTDTLHFATAPDLVPARPDGASDIVTRLPTPFQPDPAVASGKSAYLVWTFDLPTDLPALKANVTLWVDVEGSVLGDPFPSAGGCFWNLALQVHTDAPAFALSMPADLTSACVKEPLQVPTGVRAITFDLPLAQTTLQKGTRLDISIDANAEPAPGSLVAMLSGTAQHDSQITITGLGAPLSASALIQR